MQPTEAQKKAIAQIRAAERPVGWFGSIRAGKTTGAVIAFCDYLEDNEFPPSLLASFTYTLIERNLIPIIMQELEDRELSPKHKRTSPPEIRGYCKSLDKDFTIYCASANDDASRRSIQGLTLGAALLDEVVLYPQSFVMEVVARLSLPSVLMLMTANKLRPSHWIKRLWLDKDKIDNIESHTSDNPHITEKTLSRYESLLVGHYKDSMLGNVWAGEGNFICPEVKEDVPSQLFGGIHVAWINPADGCSLVKITREDNELIIEHLIDNALPENFTDKIHGLELGAAIHCNKDHNDLGSPMFQVIPYDEGAQDVADYCTALQFASTQGLIYTPNTELRDALISWSWEEKDKPEVEGISSSCFAVAYAVYYMKQVQRPFDSTEFDK